eukprot:TRINITY_DN14653_c0_g1_i1.p1 TRINITY_DN14653_c0_g1~~TRINITY_DN14653_c0_g1_i1.p1  ORF type:complete len:335 (+),score=34.98 TRINITY_DN14653_c0_g1_i1:151-1005(+)
MERIRAAQKKLDEDMASFTKMQERVNESARKANDQVTLNVGGVIFRVSRETLLVADSFFYAMLGSDRWPVPQNGEYFIDRDPDLFPIILTYLRTGKWRTGSLGQEDKNRLKAEVDYYAICKSVNLTLRAAATSITLKNDRTCSGKGTAITSQSLPQSEYFEWKVTIVEFAGTPWTSIGVCTGALNPGSLLCNQPHGCGLYINNESCYFRYNASNVESVVNSIGAAKKGKVITVGFSDNGRNRSIRFTCKGKSTREFPVELQGPIFAAISPSLGCVFSIHETAPF